MGQVRRILSKVVNFVRPDRAERELDREVASHLALLEDEYRRRGLAPEEARLAARRRLGGVDQAKERHRDERSFLWLEDARRDARYALRALARDRGFTCAALLTLTIGIGATTAIFGGVNAVLLRPLPFPEPERLVFVFESADELRFGVTAPDFHDWRRDQRVFERIAGYATTTVTLSGAGDAERVPARRVSADYFRVLGVTPVIGRDFTEADDVFGASRTVMVSDALWRSRFAADPSLVGTTIVLNSEPHAVIGVLPPGVGLFERAEQFYLPLALLPVERASTGSRFLTVIARLAPAITREQAQAEMVAIAARIQTIRPQSNTDVTARVDDMHQTLAGDLRRPLFLFLGAAVFLLLIACANVANLQLVRAVARQREVAIRSALGAGRRRLIRQFVMEGLVLAALGGIAGLGVAAFSAELIPWLIPATRPRLLGSFLDLRVLTWTSIVTLATGIFFGLTPGWQMTRRDLRGQLNESPRGSTAGGRHRTSGAFAVIQVAMALLLLIGAGLSIRSFMLLQEVNPGFRLTNMLTFRLSLPEVRYGAAGQAEVFYETLLDAMRALPGVASAGGSSSLPLRGQGVGLTAAIEGRPRPDTPNGFPRFFYRGVTPDYFKTMGVPVIRGREISPDDRAGRPRVAVINQTAAARYWKDADPVGARLVPDDDGGVVEIVGVVADTKHFGLAAQLEPEMFVAVQQPSPHYWRWTQRTVDIVLHVAINAGTLAGPVREAVRRLDRDLPVYQLMTMETVMAESVASPRHAMLLMLAGGAIALILAALGIYGVIAFIVAGRTQEIGVRVALGAARRDILTLVLGRSVRMCTLGLGLGLAGAIALSRFVGSFLFGITATDAITYTSVSALLFTIALIAAYVPARRALQIDPVTALRGE